MNALVSGAGHGVCGSGMSVVFVDIIHVCVYGDLQLPWNILHECHHYDAVA
jgi:hypothetical protein